MYNLQQVIFSLDDILQANTHHLQNHCDKDHMIYFCVTWKQCVCCYINGCSWARIQNTMWCHYNLVNFLKNSHKIHPIAHPLGRDMGCLLYAPNLIYIWPRSLQWCMQYHLILYHVITAPDCVSHWYIGVCQLSGWHIILKWMSSVCYTSPVACHSQH